MHVLERSVIPTERERVPGRDLVVRRTGSLRRGQVRQSSGPVVCVGSTNRVRIDGQPGRRATHAAVWGIETVDEPEPEPDDCCCLGARIACCWCANGTSTATCAGASVGVGLLEPSSASMAADAVTAAAASERSTVALARRDAALVRALIVSLASSCCDASKGLELAKRFEPTRERDPSSLPLEGCKSP